ncbi:DEKNAAC105043 [Brettanomyces naardenensis]|uniref:DEKNAAC105043 n=1 Tax=Brettanomyces naardenensis TaxID=13370 RepID=A0A448YS33_BRENA|nr:DEKNAAC105043 [Brettanomyces naardenensis]
MTSTEEQLKAQTHQLEEAAKLAFDNNEYFDQVLNTIVDISLSQPISNFTIQSKCLDFIYKAYYLKKIKSFDLRCKSSTKLIDMIARLILVGENDEAHHKLPKYRITERCIEILSVSYDLMFYKMINEPDKEQWSKLARLRDFIVSKWPSSYPLLPYNRDTDWSRSSSCKNAIVKFMGKVIQTHLPPPSSREKNNNNNNIDDISIAMVNKDHAFLYNSNIGTLGQALVDKLFAALNEEILIPTAAFSAMLSVLMTLFKTRPNIVSSKFLNFVLGYEAQLKRTPKFEKDKLKIKMNRRFNDRLDKIIISLLLNRGFINKDPSLKSRFENKLRYLVDKTSEQKKRNILEDSDEDEDEDGAEIQRLKKRRKLDNMEVAEEPVDFFNESKFPRAHDYRSIYSLLKPGDALEDFNMSSISPDMLSNMVITALSKVETRRLVKALSLVSDRYIEVVTRDDYENADEGEGEREAIPTDVAYDPTSANVKQEIGVKNEEDEEDGFNEEEAFSLPLPKALDINQKKQQMKAIINNFIKLASLDVKEQSDESSTGNDLGKVAISKWKSDSWIKILSRLVTRGTIANEEMSRYIREGIFNHFQTDIKDRLVSVIEWLNEEYYSETVKNEEPTVATADEAHNIYLEYTGKVLDALIPFLDTADRKIFIRLLSELPYLNKDLISRIKSICTDPVRSKLGFQSLLYLIMFRPPVFDDCISILKELYAEANEKNNEPLKAASLKLLSKYAPKEISES